MKFGFLFVLLLPIFGMIYVAWRTWHILPFAPIMKTTTVGLMVLAFILLFVSLLGLTNYLPLALARGIYEIGTSSILVLLYLFLIFLLLDVGRLAHLVPMELLQNSWKGSVAIFLAIFGIFLYGNIHYYNKVRVPIEITSKKLSGKSLKVILASDLHIGYHNTRQNLAKWVNMINGEKPDLILFAGDIIDLSLRPVIEENMAAEFKRLEAPIYACLGNHEYYSDLPGAVKFYSEAGIQLLRDSSIVYNDDVIVIGREDHTNIKRKSLAEITDNKFREKFTILLDHQPHKLEEAKACGIDFQFSGHTHAGQIWPINWIVDAIYEDGYGKLTKGNTNYYVSSGLGIWGGKFRIGSQSEYVVLTITSNNRGK